MYSLGFVRETVDKIASVVDNILISEKDYLGYEIWIIWDV